MRVVNIPWLLLGIQVVEVAEELIETVHRRQELIAVAKMVLTTLESHVAESMLISFSVRVSCREEIHFPRIAQFTPGVDVGNHQLLHWLPDNALLHAECRELAWSSSALDAL